MTDETLAKMALKEMERKLKKYPGKQPTTWMSTIEEDVESIHIKQEDVNRIAPKKGRVEKTGE